MVDKRTQESRERASTLLRWFGEQAIDLPDAFEACVMTAGVLAAMLANDLNELKGYEKMGCLTLIRNAEACYDDQDDL